MLITHNFISGEKYIKWRKNLTERSGLLIFRNIQRSFRENFPVALVCDDDRCIFSDIHNYSTVIKKSSPCDVLSQSKLFIWSHFQF